MAESLDETQPSHKARQTIYTEERYSPPTRTSLSSDGGSEKKEEYQSLEYEEDCFYSAIADTPSFDDDIEDGDDGLYWTLDPDQLQHTWTIDSDLVLSDSSDGSDNETSLKRGGGSNSPTSPKFLKNRIKFLVVRSGNLVRKVRISWTDWSKPYLDKEKRKAKYDRILALIKQKMAQTKGEEPPLVISPDDEMHGLTEEEKEKQREIWQKELAKVEEEIETLRNVLKSKVRLSQQLKKKLGFTMWRELSDDFSQGVRSVKETAVYQSVEEGLSNIGKAVVESPVYHNVEEKITQVGKVVSDNPVYQRTESVVKATAESTRTIFGGLTGGFTHKLGQIKNSESFRSLEDKVGSAYENVKTKVSSRSSSIQSFDEALREDQGSVKSPTIPEGKPLA